MRRDVSRFGMAWALLAAAAWAGGCKDRRSGAPAARPARGAAHSGAHMDHDPRHGGMVLMSGDYHLEVVVEPDGRVRVWPSDARRTELDPTAATGTVVRRPAGGARAALPLRAEPASGALMAAGPPPVGPYTDYDVDVRYRGERIQGGVQVLAGGTAATLAAAGAADDHAHAGPHEHGAAPHGGTVVAAGAGHLEARLEPSGRLTVWLLDAAARPRPARGAAATVRLATTGAVDVPLVHDPAQDALTVQLPPPASEHVTALLSVTPPGATTPTHARVTFHLEPGGHADGG